VVKNKRYSMASLSNISDTPDGPTPAVSVIIPAYNRADSIRHAIDSVLAQSMDDFELIVVDDCSTDDTVAVVNAMGDPRIRVLRHDTNRRAAAARNTGIRAALGKWVAFLDSDDAWLPDKLKLQWQSLENGPEDVRAGCTGYHLIDGDATFVKVPQLVTHQDMFMGCDLSPGSTLMVRRDVFDEVGFNNEDFVRYEDWDWALRYTAHYRMGVLPQALAKIYRGAHPSAASVAIATERWVEAHGVALGKLGASFRRKVLALRWIEVAQHCFRDGDRAIGMRYLWRGLMSTPLVRPSMYVILFDAIFGTKVQRALWRRRGRQQRGR
jgi:glycosyltransferase involved in cell wall biosynthesis